MLGLSDPYVKATVEEGGEVMVVMETSVRWQTCVLTYAHTHKDQSACIPIYVHTHTQYIAEH
jgi:hypothetical protein